MTNKRDQRQIEAVGLVNFVTANSIDEDQHMV